MLLVAGPRISALAAIMRRSGGIVGQGGDGIGIEGPWQIRDRPCHLELAEEEDR